MTSSVNPNVAGVGSLDVPSNAVISTNVTTVLKTGIGWLLGVAATIPGTGSTLTIFDNTVAAGNVLIPGLATVVVGLLGGIPSGGIPFLNGLTVVTAGAAPATVLVSFK